MSLMPKGMAEQHAREPGHVSVRNKTVAMVEGHLNKQRSAYDHWIAELCRDAEESAMERDRLKAKLAALRDDHKRKVMTKIIGRLGNMNYFVAWNHWHTVTIKDAQKRAGERIRELKKQLKECKKKTEELEAEAQRRADEAAALAFGAATDSQKKLIWKILTRLSTLKVRLFWGHWYKQTFGAKLQKLLMIKILKRMMHSFLNKGFGMWRYVTQQWELIKKLELKDQLVGRGVLFVRDPTATPSTRRPRSRSPRVAGQGVGGAREISQEVQGRRRGAPEPGGECGLQSGDRSTKRHDDQNIIKVDRKHVDAQLQGLEAQERRVHATIQLAEEDHDAHDEDQDLHVLSPLAQRRVSLWLVQGEDARGFVGIPKGEFIIYPC